MRSVLITILMLIAVINPVNAKNLDTAKDLYLKGEYAKALPLLSFKVTWKFPLFKDLIFKAFAVIAVGINSEDRF